MISLYYTSHTKAYNTIYTACNIVEAIYSFTLSYCPESARHCKSVPDVFIFILQSVISHIIIITYYHCADVLFVCS